MKVLLIGGGGREHALAWKLKQSPLLDTLYCAPGNAGIAEIAQCVALDVEDHAAVIRFCKEKSIGLVVIGPDAASGGGAWATIVKRPGIKVLRPEQGGGPARGGGGAFTKDLCDEMAALIEDRLCPFWRGALRPRAYVEETRSLPIVIKADGLAAGKGITHRRDRRKEAKTRIDACFGGPS